MTLRLVVATSYLVAATLFLLGLQRMSSPVTARSGIQWAGVGMVLATVATFLLPGLHNMAQDLISGSYGFVPLELVISSVPDLLVIDNTYPAQTSRTQSLLRHPAFRALKGRTAMMTIPSKLWLCPGPWIAEAAERLAADKSRLLDSRRAPLAQTQNRE